MLFLHFANSYHVHKSYFCLYLPFVRLIVIMFCVITIYSYIEGNQGATLELPRRFVRNAVLQIGKQASKIISLNGKILMTYFT